MLISTILPKYARFTTSAGGSTKSCSMGPSITPITCCFLLVFFLVFCLFTLCFCSSFVFQSSVSSCFTSSPSFLVSYLQKDMWSCFLSCLDLLASPLYPCIFLIVFVILLHRCCSSIVSEL